MRALGCSFPMRTLQANPATAAAVSSLTKEKAFFAVELSRRVIRFHPKDPVKRATVLYVLPHLSHLRDNAALKSHLLAFRFRYVTCGAMIRWPIHRSSSPIQASFTRKRCYCQVAATSLGQFTLDLNDASKSIMLQFSSS